MSIYTSDLFSLSREHYYENEPKEYIHSTLGYYRKSL